MESMIYADNNATTPIDSAVLHEMIPYFQHCFGNNLSPHSLGRAADAAVELARSRVAACIGADPDEIFFTSGATEANTWFLSRFDCDGRPLLLTSALEHKSVLANMSQRHRVSFVEFDQCGQVDLADLNKKTKMAPEQTVVSLAAINNEIHSMLDLVKVGQLAHANDVIFHTDATQAVGRVELRVQEQLIHAATFSAHKIYGPKGIGALYLQRCLQEQLSPLIAGGGQEDGLRAGTVAVPLVVGFGVACELAARNVAAEAERLTTLAELLLIRLQDLEVPFHVIGPPSPRQRQPGSLTLRLPGLDAEKLCEHLPTIMVSQGSACSSRGRSHVLRTLGLSDSESREVVRISLGRFNDEDEVAHIADAFARLLSEPTIQRSLTLQ